MPNKENKPHKINVATKPQKLVVKLRGIKSIDDLLTQDSVNDILRDFDSVKQNASDVIIIYLDKRDNNFYYYITPETLLSTATWLLESTKIDVLRGDIE